MDKTTLNFIEIIFLLSVCASTILFVALFATDIDSLARFTIGYSLGILLAFQYYYHIMGRHDLWVKMEKEKMDDFCEEIGE